MFFNNEDEREPSGDLEDDHSFHFSDSFPLIKEKTNRELENEITKLKTEIISINNELNKIRREISQITFTKKFEY